MSDDEIQSLACHLVSGTHDFVLSSRAEWEGIGVQLVQGSRVECHLQPVCHVVSVLASACSKVVQTRNGRTQARAVMPGDVIVTPVGPPKEWRLDERAEWISMRLDPHLVERIVRSAGHGRDRTLSDNFGTRDPFIERIGRHFLREIEQPGFATDVYGSSLAYQLAVHLLRHYSDGPLAITEVPAKLQQHKLRRAREFIEAHLNEHLTIDRIAAAVGMAPDHFAHLFREATRQPPHQFVMQRRVERAKSLLRLTELPIEQVANQVGCRSQSHFAALFRRHTGLTPRQFRRSH